MGKFYSYLLTQEEKLKIGPGHLEVDDWQGYDQDDFTGII